MSWKNVARGDVRLFLEGYCVDGVTPLARRVSFPWDTPVADAVAGVAGTMYAFMDADGVFLGRSPLRTATLFRLIAYLSRTGRVQPRAIRATTREAAMVGTVLASQPHLITQSVRFKALLLRYQRSVVRALPCQSDLPSTSFNAPPRPVVWGSADGGYALTELVHPAHLIEETKALGHCIGRTVNGVLATDRTFLALPYWLRILCEDNRVFSLTVATRPVCTLNIQCAPPCLVEAQGGPRANILSQPYTPALVAAFRHLTTMFPGLTVTPKQLHLRQLAQRSSLFPRRQHA